jgi:hypothetical protein
MMEDLFETLMYGIMIIIMAPLALAVSIVVGMVAYELSGIPCENKAKLLNVEHSHSISTGCWVKVNDRYLPIAEVVAIERDGKTIIAPKAPIRMEINK